MSAEYSVESLQHLILSQHSSTSVEAIAALRAFQERIKADEGAVPVATAVVRDEHGMPYIERMDHSLPVGTHKLFTHPPAQAAPKIIATMMHENSRIYGVEFTSEGGAEIHFRTLPTTDGAAVNSCVFSSNRDAPTAEPAAQVDAMPEIRAWLADYADELDEQGFTDVAATIRTTAASIGASPTAEPVAQGDRVQCEPLFNVPPAQPAERVAEGWTRAQAKLHERKTVHEWLNDLHIEREEFGKPLCLLRRLRILCDRYADTCEQLSFEIRKQSGWISTSEHVSPGWPAPFKVVQSWALANGYSGATDEEACRAYREAHPAQAAQAPAASPAGVPDGWTVSKSKMYDGYCVDGKNTSTLVTASNNLYYFFEALAAAPSPGESE